MGGLPIMGGLLLGFGLSSMVEAPTDFSWPS
jgi:hypothetical protein